MLFECLKNLKKKKIKNLRIPKFDKSVDDRFPKKKWQKINFKPDIVIFEGWCVGSTPQKNKDLIKPINTLEKQKDKNRIWRNRVNMELKNNYKKIFKQIDISIFLKVPSFSMYTNGDYYKKKIENYLKRKKTMNNNQIKNFIMFYERLQNIC